MFEFLIGCAIFIVVFLGLIAIVMQFSPKVRNFVAWILMILHDLIILFTHLALPSLILDHLASKYKIPSWLQILLLILVLGLIIALYLSSAGSEPSASTAIRQVY